MSVVFHGLASGVRWHVARGTELLANACSMLLLLLVVVYAPRICPGCPFGSVLLRSEIRPPKTVQSRVIKEG